MTDFLSFKPQNNDCDFERIEHLQEKMNHRIPVICPERAEIITESFKKTEGESIVLRRAKALDEILTKMSIYIEEGMLIIGNQASRNFAAPIFPEYTVAALLQLAVLCLNFQNLHFPALSGFPDGVADKLLGKYLQQLISAL